MALSSAEKTSMASGHIETSKEERREIAERVVKIRDPDVYTPFKPAPEVQPWLDTFKTTALRYPV
jgi:hypothetical protein